MPLSDREWVSVSVHEVVLAWLRAERGIYFQTHQIGGEQNAAILLDRPDLTNTDHNRDRFKILNTTRHLFIGELPPDVDWYRVTSMTNDDLHQLHAVYYDGWNDPSGRDDNNILTVARRQEPITLMTSPDLWESPILLGHSKNGPFSILEGNHRLTAYVQSGQTNLDIPVYIGLSQLKCYWNILDHPTYPLIQDLVFSHPKRRKQHSPYFLQRIYERIARLKNMRANSSVSSG
jgi:hypothetical protein